MKALAIPAAVMLAVCALAAREPTTRKDATKPAGAIPDLCKGPVDPYDAAGEKARFYKAAGKDNELTEKEYAAAKGKAGAFPRSFDTWSRLAAFDKDGNKLVDWMEAGEYRLALRRKVLAAFDADKNGKLTGAERDAANRALAEGKINAGVPSRRPRRLPMMSREDMLKKYDKDSDGELSDEERAAFREAMREEYRRRMLERYDKDGDGELSDEERQAMRNRPRGPFGEAAKRWELQHFDLDSNGELSDAERADLKVFQGKLRAVGKSIDVRFNDQDGDGKVSREERWAAMRQWRSQLPRLMAMGAAYMDADGDGQVSGDERTAFRDRTQKGMVKWFEKFGAQFDADKNGRLDVKEREAFVAGLGKSINARIEKFDADEDGRLSPAEMVEMMQDFGEEIGIPRPKFSFDDDEEDEKEKKRE